MKKIFLLLASTSSLFAVDVAIPREDNGPWFTGTLLSPASLVVDMGHVAIEPFLFAIANTGDYDGDWNVQSHPTAWNNSFDLLVEFGIAPRVDILLLPTLFWNYSQGSAHWEFGDLPLYLDIQLYYADFGNWIPNIKFQLLEIMPTGKYRNMNPHAHSTQFSGNGSWQTNIGIVLGKIHLLGGNHYLQYRIYLNYDLPSPTRVKGFNTFGGGYGTNARLFPGENFTFLTAFEVNLTLNWTFAIDFFGFWRARDHYSGFAGVTKDGLPAPLGRHSGAQFSMTPSIEYNWSVNLGIIAGAWFSFAGRNSDSFQGGSVAFNYYY